MGSKVKVVLNREGVRSLMQSQEMQTILMERGNSIASAAGKEAYVAQTRAVVEARGDDGNNSLLKGLGKNDRKKN